MLSYLVVVVYKYRSGIFQSHTTILTNQYVYFIFFFQKLF